MKYFRKSTLVVLVAASFAAYGQDADRVSSTQGIDDDADALREDTERQRREGRTPERRFSDNVEVRTYDGTFNNADNIGWGATFSDLQRLGDAAYSDGISSLIYTDRASAREISNNIVSQAPNENIPNTFGTSDYVWQWGQFIDHDLDLTDGIADDPADIEVPVGDPFFDPNSTGTAVIPFNRALFNPDTGTDASNPRQQENEISSWIDGSMIYGSDSTRADALRESGTPFLATSENNMLPFNTSGLSNANGPTADPATLFVAGDVRANEQVGLATMHTLFVREHNRLARQIASTDSDLSDEEVFQAARRLVIAELQIITYNEFLPALVGEDAIPRYRRYNDSINPTVYNEFSAAAYRLGHSMVSNQILRVGENGTTFSDGNLPLEDAFFTAPQILRDNEDLESILRGLNFQTHQAIDVRVIHPLRNLLFGQPGSGGLDLTALNIQRGRDHGLPSYNDMRVAMNLNPFSSFDQITSDVALQQSLASAYGDISKVDLWVGGLAETPVSNEGSQLGELFRAIIVKQFTDLRDGDRFWYQNDLSDAEMRLVNDVTLASVIRANTSIGDEIPDNVFMASDEPEVEPEGFLGMTFSASSFSAESNPANNNIVRDMGSKVGYLTNDSWIRFDNFDFSSGATSIEVSASAGRNGGTIQVKTGSPTGDTLATIDVPNTGGWNTFQSFSSNVDSSLSGVQDLYFVFVNGSSRFLLDFESFRVD